MGEGKKLRFYLHAKIGQETRNRMLLRHIWVMGETILYDLFFTRNPEGKYFTWKTLSVPTYAINLICLRTLPY